ncbi:hypothetical protein EI71_01853 [Anaeroplasma bactoclasticum]|jgi:hypothetical protein|uniref:Uncharacterized protein n=1 Tax=Anaeroplasma bactoclasticum TaxID=2088 RepID=A0A397QUU5_9MOLU|nr:hypothetical protein [Anaeroplasma bactoclasticum]RIA64832.1 hypothetical protein EI71_01853 [Anaeroplasma bactoclasticum]
MKKFIIRLCLVIIAFIACISLKGINASASSHPNCTLEQQENASNGNETKIRYIATISNLEDLNDINEITFYFYLYNPNDIHDQKSATYTTTTVYDEVLGENGKPKELNTYYAVHTLYDLTKFSGYTITVGVGLTYHNIKNNISTNFVSHIIRNDLDSKELLLSNPTSSEFTGKAPKMKEDATKLTKEDYCNTDFYYDNKVDGVGRWNIANKYKAVIYTHQLDQGSIYEKQKVIMDFETGNLFFYYESFDIFYGKTLTLSTYAIRKDDTYTIITEISLNSFRYDKKIVNIGDGIANGTVKFYTTMSAEDIVLNDESEGEYINASAENNAPINKNLLFNIEKYAGWRNPDILKEQLTIIDSIYGNKENGYYYINHGGNWLTVIDEYCLAFTASENVHYGFYYSEKSLLNDPVSLTGNFTIYNREELGLSKNQLFNKTYFPFAIAPYEIDSWVGNLSFYNEKAFIEKYFEVE